MQIIFPVIAMMIPGIILYNISPYTICLPNGDYMDNFYFDVKLPSKEVQFTVSFESRSANDLKVVPFVLDNGNKRQMISSTDARVIKFFVNADELQNLKAFFLLHWEITSV
jgi:hypothetical protein